MNDEKKIQINLAIPDSYRNFLRRMATGVYYPVEYHPGIHVHAKCGFLLHGFATW